MTIKPTALQRRLVFRRCHACSDQRAHLGFGEMGVDEQLRHQPVLLERGTVGGGGDFDRARLFLTQPFVAFVVFPGEKNSPEHEPADEPG